MKTTRLLLIAFILLSGCTTVKKGLVGEYLFEGNVRDNTIYKNDGQETGTTLTTGHDGKKLSAYQFNGVDQYITIPNAPQNNFDRKDDFTISFWASVSSTQNDMSVSINDLIRKWRGDTQGYPFAIVYYNSSAHDSIRNSFSFVRYDGSICRHVPSLFSGKYKPEMYHHIVCVKEGSLMKLYVNNVIASQTNDTTLGADACGSHNNADITLGARGNKVRYFTGALDDLRIYNRALSEKEIKRLFKM